MAGETRIQHGNWIGSEGDKWEEGDKQKTKKKEKGRRVSEHRLSCCLICLGGRRGGGHGGLMTRGCGYDE